MKLVVMNVYFLVFLLSIASIEVVLGQLIEKRGPRTPKLSNVFFDELSSLLRIDKNNILSSESLVKRLSAYSEKDKEDLARETLAIRFVATCHNFCHERSRIALKKIDPYYHYDIINKHTVIVSSTSSALNHLINLNFVEHFVPLFPELKLDYSIQSSPFVDGNTVNKKAVCRSFSILLTNLPESQSDMFFSFLNNLSNDRSFSIDRAFYGVKDHFISIKFLGSNCNRDTEKAVLEQLSNRHEVLWIQQKHDVTPCNRWSRGICQTGQSSNSPIQSTSFNGTSEIVGIIDTGIDMKNCYFYDPDHSVPYNVVNNDHRKVVTYIVDTNYGDYFENSPAHGTHVAGTCAGVSQLDYGDLADYDGQFHSAKIAFYDAQRVDHSMSIPTNIYSNVLARLYSAGARVFSNSWVESGDHTYSAYAASIDEFMWDYPDTLIFFATGNDGLSGYGSVSAPATFKNGISVGASLNDHDSWLAYTNGKANSLLNPSGVAYFSSRGPTLDGRVKPDIVAPGAYITSALGKYNSTSMHCDVEGMSGTSMAAPAAAGIATIIRSYFLQGYYPHGSASAASSFIPSGALIKAMIIHSGVGLDYVLNYASNGTVKSVNYFGASDYPNNIQGYGRIELNKILNFVASTSSPINLMVMGSLNSSFNHYVEIGSNSTHNYTITTGVSSSSIRITLCYTDPPSFAGSSNPILNSLYLSLITPSASIIYPYSNDSNVQVIDISAPISSSSYIISISSDSLTSTQPYALVVTGDVIFLNSTVVVAPSASSSLVSLSNATVTLGMIRIICSFGALSVILILSLIYIYKNFPPPTPEEIARKEAFRLQELAREEGRIAKKKAKEAQKRAMKQRQHAARNASPAHRAQNTRNGPQRAQQQQQQRPQQRVQQQSQPPQQQLRVKQAQQPQQQARVQQGQPQPQQLRVQQQRQPQQQIRQAQHVQQRGVQPASAASRPPVANQGAAVKQGVVVEMRSSGNQANPPRRQSNTWNGGVQQVNIQPLGQNRKK